VNEHDMLKIARSLGARAAERLDVERTAQAVVERLRGESPPRVARWSWVQPAWLRIAAAVIVLVGGGALVARQTLWPGGVGHAPAHLVTDDIGDLSADQLREVLSTMDDLLNVGGTSQPDVQLDDLDAQQLRSVLRSLEG
jgi:hypothetical protein